MSRSDLSWRPLFLVTFLAAYLYVFNEWLFAITKPYFMNDLSFMRQLQILLTIGALLASLCFLALLPLLFLSLLPPLKRYTPWWIKLGALLPWDPLKRVPLIIRFPHGQYAGRIQVNVQNLDIAPTLLDYLALMPPDWMRGASLIPGELEQRPIFSASIINEETDPDKPIVVDWTKAVAPFYQFGDITVIYCREWFRLDLSVLSWERGVVEGSTSACPADSEMTDQ